MYYFFYINMYDTFSHTRNRNWLTIPTTDRILFEYDGDEQWRQGLEIASQQMVDQYF